MPVFPVGPAAAQVWAGQGPVLIANQDLAQPVTVGTRPGLAPGDGDCDLVPPLGSIAYTGGIKYAAAAAGTAPLLVIAGGTSWAPSPADVALQIQALGLATNAAVLQVNGTLGSPAQDGTVGRLAAPGQTIAQEGQALGVPPSVPALKAATIVRKNVSISTFFTFGGAGRIWAVALSYFVTTNNSYTLSTSQTYAAVETGSGLTLGIVELGAANPNQAIPGQSNLAFNGLPISNGDTLNLDVNAGSVITNLNQRASALVLYSIP